MLNTSNRISLNARKRPIAPQNSQPMNNENPAIPRPSLKFLMSTVPRRAIRLDPCIRPEPLHDKPQCPTAFIPISTQMKESRVSLGNEIEPTQSQTVIPQSPSFTTKNTQPNAILLPTFGRIESEPLMSLSSEIIPKIQISESIVRPVFGSNRQKSFKKKASEIRKMSQFEKLLENTQEIRKMLSKREGFYENSQQLLGNTLIQNYEEVQQHAQNQNPVIVLFDQKTHLQNIKIQEPGLSTPNKRYLQVISFSNRNTSFRDSNDLSKPTDYSLYSTTRKRRKGIEVLSSGRARCYTQRYSLNSDRSSILYKRSNRIKTNLELENQQTDNQKSSCCD